MQVKSYWKLLIYKAVKNYYTSEHIATLSINEGTPTMWLHITIVKPKTHKIWQPLSKIT